MNTSNKYPLNHTVLTLNTFINAKYVDGVLFVAQKAFIKALI